jgi:3-mercaptopyruvate sulfurtransferase SseA
LFFRIDNRALRKMSAIKKTVFALVAITITVGYLWHANRVVTPKAATWNDILAEAQQGGYRIIDTDALWNRYQKDPETLLLVDTRQEWEYRTGHIKGALNFPIEPTWLSRWRNKGALEKFLGPDKNRFIVFY